MIKKTVTYTDFNGVKRTEDFYFNLTEAELTELEYGVEGGFRAMVKKIIDEENHGRLIEYFKKIVLLAYGEKSADGRRFVKSEEIRNGFAPTEAYSKIFMELANDDKAAAAFINGIIPNEAPVQADGAEANK